MPIKVLFVTSEVAPFSKTGGLADISAALPLALKKLGCDVRILTPKYGIIKPELLVTAYHNPEIETSLEFHNQTLPISFREEHNGHVKLPVYFLECDPLYDRLGIYVDPLSNQDYVDNDDRYILLAKSAFALCEAIDWKPDIFHCHDWESSLIPFYHRQTKLGESFPKSRSLLTIHNMAYHGLFGKDTLHRIGGAETLFYPGGPVEFYDKVNFLKIGLEFSDMLNTVSPTYAREIQSAYEYGWGLEHVLKARSNRLVGIVNGIDVDMWNPAADSHIPANYSVDSLEKKRLNKKALCERVGFDYDDKIPLIGTISRIVHQKGFQILTPVLSEILNQPTQMVLLGTGDPYLEHVFRETANAFPDRFSVTIGYDEELSHLIEAGADIFLMPSLYEPCGLNQMMSMRYGTLPVVRSTGGLADTVKDVDSDPRQGTGFSFTEYNPQELLKTIRRACSAYHDRDKWRAIQKNAMSADFSWNRSAELYLDLYQFCLDNPPWTPL